MAETLGSLIDKLTIKEIREYHICQMIESDKQKLSKNQLKEKLNTLKRQKLEIMTEIDIFIASAFKGKLSLRDEKLKLYNELKDMGRIPQTKSLGEAISGLANKNLELWHLEDEARRNNKGLAYVGSIKRKIDRANQQRNDLIDKIDELFEKKVKGRRK